MLSRGTLLPAPTVVAGRHLRVAMLAPISWRVPPRHYGPWERVVALLTEGVLREISIRAMITPAAVTRTLVTRDI